MRSLCLWRRKTAASKIYYGCGNAAAITAARFAMEDEVVGVDVEREVGMTGKLVDH